MPIPLSGKIVISKQGIKDLEKYIIEKVSATISERILTHKEMIELYAKAQCRERLRMSPELQSILDNQGLLRLDLGIENNLEVVNDLIEDVVENIHVNVQKTKTSANIFVKTWVKITKDYDYFFKQAYAHYESINAEGESYDIEWLKWLLEAGYRDIIFNYRVMYQTTGVSRTGEAIMVKSNTANWRVPPQFAGTVDNNFITRAIEGIEKDIDTFVEGLIR